MANFCLVPQAVENFKKALVSGELNPAELALMSSVERRTAFASVVGESSAKEVNALFESKLLLKNQKAGMVSWAKKVTGITPQVRRDLIAKVNRLESVLSEPELNKYLEDLVDKRLNTEVSFEEAHTLTKLSQEVAKQEALLEAGGDRLEYGRAVTKLNNTFNEMKLAAEKLDFSDLKTSKGAFKLAKEVGNRVPGTFKSLQAAYDFSALLNQGSNLLKTNPKIWWNNARSSVANAVKRYGSRTVLDELNADIVSRPNYRNGLYKKAKLAVGTVEEAFPESLIEKIPTAKTRIKPLNAVLNAPKNLYSATEQAFTAFSHKARADVFDKYIEIAKKSGIELTENQLQSMGSVANSLLKRSNLGPAEQLGKALNNIFYSPRALVADVNVLTAHAFEPNFSGFARKQAALNLLKIIIGNAALLATINFAAKASGVGYVELDPRSSDFGSLVWGHTRIKLTGGMAALLTLSTRFLSGQTKSSSGAISRQGDFGAPGRGEMLFNFLNNKTSPAINVTKELYTGQDFAGNPITKGQILKGAVTPLPFQTAEELLKDPKAAPFFVAMLADVFGAAANTYSPTANNWNNSPGKELTQFKNKVGQAKFDEANDVYNSLYEEEFGKLKASQKYQEASDEDKKKAVNKLKNETQAKVFGRYNFKYNSKAK